MWTDERLDDLAQKVDAGFDRLDRDIRELRALMFQLWGANILATVLATAVAVAATRI